MSRGRLNVKENSPRYHKDSYRIINESPRYPMTLPASTPGGYLPSDMPGRL